TIRTVAIARSGNAPDAKHGDSCRRGGQASFDGSLPHPRHGRAIRYTPVPHGSPMSQSASRVTESNSFFGEPLKFFRVLLLIALGVRLLYAAMLQLHPDEAFYWVLSRHLALGYLDHP